MCADSLVDRPRIRLGPSGGIRIEIADRSCELHPRWLRDRSEEPGQIEATNRQRLFTPLDLPDALSVITCSVTPNSIDVEFSDGHRAAYRLDRILMALGWRPDPEEPPASAPWSSPLAPIPSTEWRRVAPTPPDDDLDAIVDALGAFHRRGVMVLRDVPTTPGTLRQVADRLGHLSPTSFGELFDVKAVAQPTDLAYTAIGLLAHTDQPYRRPVPGIQLLHCLRNDAPGGDSTIVDGLAASIALAVDDPGAYAALCEVEVEYRYDMITDTVVDRGVTIDVDRRGRFRSIRFNTKLDSPVVDAEQDLDAFYRGRRWLVDWLNDPRHQSTFRLEAGDVLVIDNHRCLHGRTPFDPAGGQRHLQGCYVEHDGPDTRYRLAVRRHRARMAG